MHIYISLMTDCGAFSYNELNTQKPIGISRRNMLKRTKAKKQKAKRWLRSELQVKLQILTFINILNFKNRKGEKKSNQRYEASSEMTKFASNVGTFGIERKSADSEELQKDSMVVRVKAGEIQPKRSVDAFEKINFHRL